MTPTDRMPDVITLQARLASHGFIVERSFAAALLLTMEMRRPLLLEGEAGVGKTEAAKALARLLDVPLIRLQCYEGLDAHTALYEWNYAHQLLAIKLFEQDARPLRDKEQEAHIARGVEVNMALSERSRRADAHAINTFAWLAGEAADRLDKGVDPNEVAAWLRGQRAAISERHDRERRAPRAA